MKSLLLLICALLTGCFQKPDSTVVVTPQQTQPAPRCYVVTVLNVNRCTYQPSVCPSGNGAYCSVVISGPNGQEYSFACDPVIGAQYQRCL